MNQRAEVGRKPADSKTANGVRELFAIVCCLPLLMLRFGLLLMREPMFDFISYWASGHLFLTGGQPYSDAAVAATQRMQGWSLPGIMMMTFCPPWALPVLGVMALLPFRAAQMTWFGTSLALNCFSALGLWNYYGGERKKAWIAILVAATFFPMGGAEIHGQITPLMLASLTAFLLLLRSKRYFWAGMMLYGFGFKPHLLYLLSLAILFWIVQKRAWTMLTGAAVSYGMATGAAWLYNRNSLDYLGHTFNAAMGVSCGLGGVLRGIFGVQHSWLQFVPCFFGAAWFLWYWNKHRSHWDWRVHLPLLLLVSVGSSPYYWYHDFILILPALIALAVRGCYRSYLIPITYLALQALIFEAYKISEAWRSASCILWIAFYLVAQAEAAQGGLGASFDFVPPDQNREPQGV
jgi:hypothetical protein